MSGLPSVDGVAEVYELIANSVALADEINSLHTTISESTQRYKSACEEYENITCMIREKMVRMDVASNVNYGWQGRLAWFLAEFYRQRKNKEGV